MIRVGGRDGLAPPTTSWTPKADTRELPGDYLAIFEEKLGVSFEVTTGPTWTELLDAIRRHELDMLPALWKTAERESFLDFTTSYATCEDFIFVPPGSSGL